MGSWPQVEKAPNNPASHAGAQRTPLPSQIRTEPLLQPNTFTPFESTFWE
jgi:hypothetical protein